MERNKRKVIFLLKAKDLDREIELDSGDTNIKKALEVLLDNWSEYGLDHSLFGEIESLRIVLREE